MHRLFRFSYELGFKRLQMTPGVIEKLATAASKAPNLLSESGMGKGCRGIGGNPKKKSEEDKVDEIRGVGGIFEGC